MADGLTYTIKIARERARRSKRELGRGREEIGRGREEIWSYLDNSMTD